MRRGFTLSETMVATLITGVVLTAVMSSFLSAQRMLSVAMAESETAVAARSIREKLLFHASPTLQGVHYMGMLSGTNTGWIVETGSGIVSMSMGALGNSITDVRQQSMRLVLGEAAGRTFLVNERTPDKDRHLGWLWPGRFSLVDRRMSDIVSVEAKGNQPSGVYRVNVDVNLIAKGPGHEPVVHRERVSVPLLGRIQPLTDEKGEY